MMIDGHTKIFGILGRPVAHTLSPAMHNAAFRKLGVNAVYVAFPVPDLTAAVAGLRGLNLAGVSVTLPFKEEIIPLLDELDPRAVQIREYRGEPQWPPGGYNTDWLGALTALQAGPPSPGHFLIPGGAAWAIAFGLKRPAGHPNRRARPGRPPKIWGPRPSP
jgi:shikimate dehydrogenase